MSKNIIKKVIILFLLLGIFFPVDFPKALETSCQIAANVDVPENFDIPVYVVVYNIDTEEEFQINLLPENDFRGRTKVTPGEYIVCQISALDDLTCKYPFEIPYDTIVLEDKSNYTISSKLINYDEVDQMIKDYIEEKDQEEEIVEEEIVVEEEPIEEEPIEEEEKNDSLGAKIVFIIIAVIVFIFIIFVIYQALKRAKE